MSAPFNAKVSIDQLVFKSLYYRYKQFTTPLIIIGVCFLLFWFVDIPQIQGWFALRDAIQVDQQNLDIMHKNLSVITSLDEAQLNNSLAVATNALPTDKDFAGILSSLQSAAAVAGTSLGDYSFSLGDLTGLDQQGRATAQLPVQLNIILKSDLPGAVAFIKQLRNQLPLSDATSLSANSNSTVTVSVEFYYATLPKIAFNDQSPLPVLGSADQRLLQTLSANSNLGTLILATPSGTVAKNTPTPSISPSPTIAQSLTPTATGTPNATGSAK